MNKARSTSRAIVLSALLALPLVATAQEALPPDNGLANYHTAPRWRESEEHPLRVLAYVFHPVGWVAREVLFRPLSFFASSTEVTRSVMGFREPYDYRTPECFSADDSIPDCRSVLPFNYEQSSRTSTDESPQTSTLVSESQVFFPNVNFDFNKRTLNALGKGRARQVAEMLKQDGTVKVVLEGHADYLGTDNYNQKLGLDRAEAVRAELVTAGVSGERLSTVTFGESQPLINEQTDYARAVNRRVEVHVDSKSAESAVVPAAE